MLSNQNISEEDRVFAAVLLYKRGSRFVSFQEYAPYKDRVLDFMLNEYSKTPTKPFAPNTMQDMMGRLHSRHNEIKSSVDYYNTTHFSNREKDKKEHADNLAVLGESNSVDHNKFSESLETLSCSADRHSENISSLVETDKDLSCRIQSLVETTTVADQNYKGLRLDLKDTNDNVDNLRASIGNNARHNELANNRISAMVNKIVIAVSGLLLLELGQIIWLVVHGVKR